MGCILFSASERICPDDMNYICAAMRPVRPRRLAWTDYRPAEPETWVRIPAGASGSRGDVESGAPYRSESSPPSSTRDEVVPEERFREIQASLVLSESDPMVEDRTARRARMATAAARGGEG